LIFVLQVLTLAVYEPPIIIGIAIAANAPSIKTAINNSTRLKDGFFVRPIGSELPKGKKMAAVHPQPSFINAKVENQYQFS